MKSKSVFIGHWCYTKPDFVPKENGDIVIIKKVSFGPLEVYEWGIDFNNTPYQFYKWVEDDFYGEEGDRINITREELLNQILSVVLLFKENGLSEWITIYGKILDGLNFMLPECFERAGEVYQDRKKNSFPAEDGDTERTAKRGKGQQTASRNSPSPSQANRY